MVQDDTGTADPTSALSRMRLLPTPDAYSADRGGAQHPDKRRAGGHSVTIQDVAEFELFPTPTTRDWRSGEASEETRGRNSRPLNEAVLLPTPQGADAEGGHATRSGARGDELLLPGVAVAAAEGLLPTPTTTPETGNGHARNLGAETRHLPTPRASRGASNTETAYALGGGRTDDDRTQGEVTLGEVDWGPYRAAIERAESVLGRPAPSPVRHDGRNGKARLNPELPEFMMGWPAGHVTNPAIWEGSGLSDNQIRNAELKGIGNGVATPQAILALRHLLSREGVPRL